MFTTCMQNVSNLAAIKLRRNKIELFTDIYPKQFNFTY